MITIVLLFFPLIALSQYYPAPKPESVANEGYLSRELVSKSGENKIDVLLRLANLNLNKPFRRKADLNRALAFGTAARDSSIKHNDKKRTVEAQLLAADIFTFLDNMKGAEDILSTLKDTSRIELCLNLSYKYWQRVADEEGGGDLKKAMSLAEEARRLSIEYHLPIYEILALKDIAIIHAEQSAPSTEKEYLQVLTKYQALKYPYLHYTFIAMAEYYFNQGIPDKAEYYCQKAIKSMKATADTLFAGDIYYVYAVISFNNENFQKAFDLCNTAIGYLKVHAGRFCLSDRIIFMQPVRALRKMKRYREAIEYTRRIQSEYPAVTPKDQIGDAAILGNIYRDMKTYDKAEKVFLNALRISQSQHLDNSELYMDIGQLYVESKQYNKARPFLYKVFDNKSHPMALSTKRLLNYLLFLADSASGHYLLAIKHMGDHRRMEEFNLRQKLDKETKRLEVQYDTKQKEDKIKFLNQKAELDQNKLQKANLLRNVTIGGIVLVLIIAGLLYRQSSLRQKHDKITTNKNEQLQKLVAEKEWLLKEVHHRVKNNLHTVICLLESQAAYLENDALKAIENSEHRIYAMSLIHQKLYQSDDIKTIDMSVYVPELVQSLEDSFGTSGQIKFKLKIDPINLSLSHAIPLGLIINEAVTNSIKYAFPGNRNGEISISMVDHGKQVILELADNGIGMPQANFGTESNSLGLELMKGLSKDIEANIRFDIDDGTKITIIFETDSLNNPDSFSKSSETQKMYV